MESKNPDVRLDSWKEIASHLRRDIRTVQRWEKLEGLPVHRHQHLKRGSPFAYAGELDTWWEGRGRSLDKADASTPPELLDASPASPARWFTTPAARWVIGGLALALFTTAVVRNTGRAEPASSITRLSITLPPDAEMRVPYQPAISPDGRQLAVVGYDQKGVSRIWVRPLDSLTAAPLAGTEGAEWPFWSPDSRNLGFFAAGSLKIVAIDSGEARVVTKAPNGRGGTWVGNVILFAPFLDDGLYSVAASGGAPVRVTTVRKADGETSHRWPQFLPDGRSFIFYVVGGTNVRGTHAGTMDQAPHTLVLATNAMAVHNAGYLLFWRDNKLAAQPFDEATRTVHGQALFLPDRVGYAQTWGISYASASQNGVLVYDPSAQSVATQLTWYDRGGRVVDTVGPVTSGPPWVALARNGEQAAVQRWDSESRRVSIWLGDLERRAWSRFTFGESGEMWPVWSPDGRRLAFASTRSSGLAAIYEVGTSTHSGEKLLLQESTVLTPLDWSPDGRHLLFQSIGAAQNRHIKALSLSEPRQIMKFPELDGTQFDAITARFSPDGRWVAYASNESGTFEVYVRPFPFTAGSKHAVSNAGGYSPRWRPDGKELFYLGPDRRLMSVAVSASTPLRLGMPQPLFELPVQVPGRATGESPFDVSADGTRFLVDRVLRTTDQPLTVVLNWTSGLQH